MKRVTLNIPLSLSSNSRLKENVVSAIFLSHTDSRVDATIFIWCLKMLFIQWSRREDITHFDERGTTISASVSYVFCQSAYDTLRGKKINIVEPINISVQLHRSEILKSPHSLWYNHEKSYEVL